MESCRPVAGGSAVRAGDYLCHDGKSESSFFVRILLQSWLYPFVWSHALLICAVSVCVITVHTPDGVADKFDWHCVMQAIHFIASIRFGRNGWHRALDALQGYPGVTVKRMPD